MDLKKEYAELIAGASKHIELLYHAGVYDLVLPPKSVSCADKWVVTEGEAIPCPAHGGLCGDSLALWSVGGLALAYGFAVSVERPSLGAEEAAQMEKIISWLSSELKTAWQGPFTVTAYRCAGAGDAGEGLKALLPAAEERIKALSPMVAVLMGPIAAGLFGIHDTHGIKAVTTRGIDELIKDPGLKKQALGDLKTALSALGA